MDLTRQTKNTLILKIHPSNLQNCLLLTFCLCSSSPLLPQASFKIDPVQDRPAKGNFIGLFEVIAHRDSAGKGCDGDRAGLQLPENVKIGSIPLHGCGECENDFADPALADSPDE